MCARRSITRRIQKIRPGQCRGSVLEEQRHVVREVAGVESLEIDDMGEVVGAECEHEAAVCNGVTGALVLLRWRYRHARRPLGGGDRAYAPCQADERAAEVV